MTETIHVGPIEMSFLLDKQATGGSLDFFAMTVPPGGKMPVAHYHRGWDEIVYGQEGALTVTIDGKAQEVGPGEVAFIRRGVVHSFENKTGSPVKCLSVLTPGQGPEYFRELSALVADGEPDEDEVKKLMQHHGLVPA